MPKKYSDEFKKDALKHVEDHPELDKKIVSSSLVKEMLSNFELEPDFTANELLKVWRGR